MEVIKKLLEELTFELNMPTVASDLGILQNVLYKRHNTQRKFKFFRVFKQIQTLMRKFIHLNLKKTLSNNLRKMREASDKPEIADGFIPELLLSLYQGFMLLQEVNKLCLVATRHCQQEISLVHYTEMHIVLVSIASRLYVRSNELRSIILKKHKRLRKIGIERGLKASKLPRLQIKAVSIPTTKKTEKRKASQSELMLKKLFRKKKSKQEPPPDESQSDKQPESQENEPVSFLSSIQSIFAATENE